MFTTYRLVVDSLGILMEGTPSHIDPEELEASLLEIPGVVLVHDLHVWNLTAGKVRMTQFLATAQRYHLRQTGVRFIRGTITKGLVLCVLHLEFEIAIHGGPFATGSKGFAYRAGTDQGRLRPYLERGTECGVWTVPDSSFHDPIGDGFQRK